MKKTRPYRHRKPLNAEQRKALVQGYLSKEFTTKELAEFFNVSVNAVYKTLWREGVATGPNSKKRIEEGRCVDGVSCKTELKLSPNYDHQKKVRFDATEAPQDVQDWREQYPIIHLDDGSRTRRRDDEVEYVHEEGTRPRPKRRSKRRSKRSRVSRHLVEPTSATFEVAAAATEVLIAYIKNHEVSPEDLPDLVARVKKALSK